MSVGPETRSKQETQLQSPAILIEFQVPPRAWPRNLSLTARSSQWALGDRRQQEKNNSGPTMMRQCFLLVVIFFTSILIAQTTPKEKSPNVNDKPGSFDRHDLSGKWNRVSPCQTYRNVPGGANELRHICWGRRPLHKNWTWKPPKPRLHLRERQGSTRTSPPMAGASPHPCWGTTRRRCVTRGACRVC